MYYIIFICLYYIFIFYFFLDILLPLICNKIEFFINQHNLKIEETKKLEKKYFELLFLFKKRMIEPYQIVELIKIEKLLPRDTIINYYDIINNYIITEADIKKEYNEIYNKINNTVHNDMLAKKRLLYSNFILGFFFLTF